MITLAYGSERPNVTVDYQSDPGAIAPHVFELWPGDQGALTLQVRAEGERVHVAVSGDWPEEPNATLVLRYSTVWRRGDLVRPGFLSAKGRIEGEISQAVATVMMAGSAFGVPLPVGSPFDVAEVVAISRDDGAETDQLFFEVRLTRGLSRSARFTFELEHIGFSKMFKPQRNFVDPEISDVQACAAVERVQSAFTYLKEMISQIEQSHHLDSGQGFIEPFLTTRKGDISYPFIVANRNAFSWYATDPRHYLEFYRTEGLVLEGDIVLDCGAHTGQHAVYMAKVVGPRGHVFAFDPFPQNNCQINANGLLNGLDNLTVVWAGVGSRQETVKVSNEQQNLAANLESADAIEVKTVMLDQYIAQRPKFVKMDIEGFEVEALRGAQVLLHEARPRLHIEVHTQFLPKFGVQTPDLFSLIPSTGYRIVEFEEGAGGWSPLDRDRVWTRPGHVYAFPS